MSNLESKQADIWTSQKKVRTSDTERAKERPFPDYDFDDLLKNSELTEDDV
jgi:hypothetical protein